MKRYRRAFAVLIQFQCSKEGSIFYYQSVASSVNGIISRCPICGSKRVSQTGRVYRAVAEAKQIKRGE